MNILTIDPGETTGYAAWCGNGFVEFGQESTKSPEQYLYFAKKMRYVILSLEIERVQYESFRLYRHKAQSQINSSFVTCEVIGVIKYLYADLFLGENIELVEKPASYVKSIWSDSKLRQHGFYQTGKFPHANDAIRHALTAVGWHKRIGSEF